MTATAPEATLEKKPPASAASMLELKRFEHSQGLVNSPGRDLADLSDTEFEDGLRRLKLVQQRMNRILKEALVEDVHYGREKQGNGRPVFKKDRLKKAGAEELRRLMKLTIRDVEAPVIIADAEWVSVVVTCGIFDNLGRLIAVQQGSCNTKEKRFKKFDGTGWIYTDPREEQHNCLAMARKRAGGLLTSEASGATAFFADGDELTEALEEEDKAIAPWNETEKALVFDACKAKGMGRKTLEKLVSGLLGRVDIGTGDEAKKVLAAVQAWQKPVPAAAPDEAQRQADLALDRELEGKEGA